MIFYILGAACVVWTLLWVIARLSRPSSFNVMSDSWREEHKYDRRQQRPD